MLTAPLDRCGILLLTSRCWDKPLARALHARCVACQTACLATHYQTTYVIPSHRVKLHLVCMCVWLTSCAIVSSRSSHSCCRLIRDLPDESVVVDYNDDLAKAMPDTDPGTDPDAAVSSNSQRESFEVIGSCVVPVSWDSQQRMYVMRRRQR